MQPTFQSPWNSTGQLQGVLGASWAQKGYGKKFVSKNKARSS